MSLKKLCAALVLMVITGCGGPQPTVNVITVHDGRTLTCNQARQLTSDVSETDRQFAYLYRTARSKLNWCEADGGGVIVAGYFDATSKIYEFRQVSGEDLSQIGRLCMDLAGANNIFDTPADRLQFQIQTADGGSETLTCGELAAELLETRFPVLVAPANLPLLIDIDPVLVLATGANPQLEGVPHRYYDEVRDRLAQVLNDL